MKVVYVETSAVLTWLLSQAEADEVRQRIDAAETVVTSALTLTETERALVRAESAGLIRAGDGQRLRGLIHRAWSGWMTMAVTEEVLRRAAGAFPVEPVRTLDAIHLATALTFLKAFADLRLFSFDRRVLQNAEALGIG